jgi:acetyltransferase
VQFFEEADEDEWMSALGLNALFRPTSVAVIGASDRPRSFGSIAMRNLLDDRFPDPIMPVNPHHRAVAGVLAYAGVEQLPFTPDLAVLCTPAATVPDLLDRLGRRGTKAAIVAARNTDPAAMLAAARPYGLRVLGGGSLGVLVPRSRLNASFAHMSAPAGRVAFVSQSGALSTAVLDWARPRGIGFSHFVSLGDGADIDFGDMMDYLANDEDTRAILLYIESISQRRDFMPAARAAARNKPLVMIRAGRSNAVGPLAPFLAESLAATDDVFDAVVRRAGALRVKTLDELFGAVETLARTRQIRGERLAIISNGGGTAMMAMDELNAAEGGEAAQLSPDTLAKLAAALPAECQPANPLDLGMAAPASSYAAALRVLAKAPEVDNVLVIHAPAAMVDGLEVAQSVIATQKSVGGALLTCWAGAESAHPARRLLGDAGIPTYDTLGAAVRGFRHLVHYQRNQNILLETPPADPGGTKVDRAAARAVIERGLAAPDGHLGDADTRALLNAYGIPAVSPQVVRSAEEAAAVAKKIGFPVALTVSSPHVARKWDVGGVALNLENAEAVRAAADGVLRRLTEHRPDAQIDGFAVQPMVLRPHARQLMLGIACDPLFGPVLVFGEGGRAVEVIRDHTIDLPPLNLPLARRVLSRTRISRLLDAHGMRPAADRDAIAQALVRVSAMLADNPEILACDINPLFADDQGVLAVDARIRVAPPDGSDRRRLAVRPYPAGLEERVRLGDGSEAVLRPIRPDDEPAHAELTERVTPHDLRYRFFGAVRQLQHAQLARLTQIDYDREMAFIATRPRADGRPETLGVVRTVTDPDNRHAELAILVRSDLKGTGLGTILLKKTIGYHQARGTAEIGAQILSENTPMLALARKCGFILRKSEDPDSVECVLRL